MIVEEGLVKIYAPAINIKGPGKAGDIFYNRAMVINRDTTIFLLSNLKVKYALDGLAATGVRGIRMIKECNVSTVINDINPKAVEVIKRNAELNGIETKITNRDVNSLMAEERFDYIDIDPFGSPVAFIDMGLRSGRILGITATDTATLGGRNRKARRRYLVDIATPPHYTHEIGIRVLLGYVGRMAARFDLGIEPIFSMWHGHFYRIYIRVKRGVSNAKRTLEKIGMCEYGGPLWLDSLHDFSYLEEAKLPSWLPSYEKLKKYIELWKGEKFFLFHHLPTISSYLKKSTPPINRVIEYLRELGYEAYRTHFSPEGVKTNAPRDIIEKIILED